MYFLRYFWHNQLCNIIYFYIDVEISFLFLKKIKNFFRRAFLGMYIKINGKIYIHTVFLLLPLVFFSEGCIKYAAVFFCAFLHELAHFCAALLCGVRSERIFIAPYGFELRIKEAPAGAEIFIYAAGPLLSLILCVLFYISGSAFLFRANAVLFAFNMLPALPLDGGRLARIVLWKNAGVYRGNRILRFLSISSALCLGITGICISSVWCFFASALIFSRTISQKSVPFYKKRGKNVPQKHVFMRSDAPVRDVMRKFSPYYYLILHSDCAEYGVHEKDIVKAIEKNGCEKPVKELFCSRKANSVCAFDFKYSHDNRRKNNVYS